MQNAKRIIKTALRPLYTAFHDYRYDRYYHAWLENSLDGSPANYTDLTARPLISVVVPTYNTDERFFREMVESVVSQVYKQWELILVDDCSPDAHVRGLIKEYAARDTRIKYEFLDENVGISGATNKAIAMSSGEFVALFDHDDILHPNALFEVAVAVNRGGYDFIYTDEDKITDGRRGRHQPFCKPAWNSDFLRSVNYITHFTVIRRSLLEKVGYEDGDYNGAQDWELILRCTRTLPDEKIYHIPQILYSWRVHDKSTAKDLAIKPYVFKAQRSAIEADLKARGVLDAEVVSDTIFPGQWQVKRKPIGSPRVSVFVDSRAGRAARKEIDKKTSYHNYDVTVVDETATMEKVLSVVDSDFIAFIQEKPAIKSADWIQDMIGDAQRPEIGFVQAGLTRSASVAKNIEALLGPNEAALINGLSKRNVSKHLYTTTRYNLPIVHGGVVVVETSKLKKVLDGSSATNIATWSKALHNQHYLNLYNPYVEVLK